MTFVRRRPGRTTEHQRVFDAPCVSRAAPTPSGSTAAGSTLPARVSAELAAALREGDASLGPISEGWLSAPGGCSQLLADVELELLEAQVVREESPDRADLGSPRNRA